MARTRIQHSCTACGQQMAQWVGRCPGCGGWGTIEEASVGARTAGPGKGISPLSRLGAPIVEDRMKTGSEGLDRILGDGLVPGSVGLLAGEPGIGKSTLLLQLLANLSRSGVACLLASGEESHEQVAARARRLGIAADDISFMQGRDLSEVLSVASAVRPAVLAVDSIQTLRDTSGTQTPGGVSQVRTCTDAVVGLAKAEGIAVLLTGHVTKDGDLAGPRALEHAVDVVLSFDGDARSGLRVLAGGKNRFGAEGETAWFEMGPQGLTEIDPTDLLVSGDRSPGTAIALPRSGRRALAVEVQALIGSPEGPARRQATGIDTSRFHLIAAVLDRVASGLKLGRSELFGAASGGIRVDDPACDLAIAAALASAATGLPPPQASAFVGEVSLNGLVRPAPGMAQRAAAARAAGCRVLFAASDGDLEHEGISLRRAHGIRDALSWAFETPIVSARTHELGRSA